jgi:N-acetylneuraminic acid mutarotase
MFRQWFALMCLWAVVAAGASPLAHGDEASVKLPDVPHPVTSFGGAVIGDYIYIYGGHEGDAHDYYIEGQSKSLWRLNVVGKPEWKEVAQGPSLQGLAMVAHDGKLYRLGGFTAKNSKGEDQDLWSVADAASFDPASSKWTALPALPEPRSSFDAAVANSKIYVIGGWQMQGNKDSVWHKTAYELDLEQAEPKWKALTVPPFQRRALSVATFEDRVYAIGGMKQDGPSTEVHVFDIASGEWSPGPAIPGKGMEGFGSSAYAVGGKLYVSTFSGMLYRLSDDTQSWEKVQKLERDRFFHRMLPLGDDRLVFVGGASMASGKFAEVDVVKVK